MNGEPTLMWVLTETYTDMSVPVVSTTVLGVYTTEDRALDARALRAGNVVAEVYESNYIEAEEHFTWETTPFVVNEHNWG